MKAPLAKQRPFDFEYSVRARTRRMTVWGVDEEDARRKAQIEVPWCKHFKLLTQSVRARDDVA